MRIASLAGLFALALVAAACDESPNDSAPIFSRFPIPLEAPRGQQLGVELDYIFGIGGQAMDANHILPIRHAYLYMKKPQGTSVPRPVDLVAPADADIYQVARLGGAGDCQSFTLYLRSSDRHGDYIYYYFDHLTELSRELFQASETVQNPLPPLPREDILNGTGDLNLVPPWINSRTEGTQGNCIGSDGTIQVTSPEKGLTLALNLPPHSAPSRWPLATHVQAGQKLGKVGAYKQPGVGLRTHHWDWGYLDPRATAATPLRDLYENWTHVFGQGIRSLGFDPQSPEGLQLMPNWVARHPARYVNARSFLEALAGTPLQAQIAAKIRYELVHQAGDPRYFLDRGGEVVWDVEGFLRGCWFSDPYMAERNRGMATAFGPSYVPSRQDEGAFCITPAQVNKKKYSLAFGADLTARAPESAGGTRIPYAALYAQVLATVSEFKRMAYTGEFERAVPGHPPAGPGTSYVISYADPWLNPDPALVAPGRLAVYLLREPRSPQGFDRVSYLLALMTSPKDLWLKVVPQPRSTSGPCHDEPESASCLSRVLELIQQQVRSTPCAPGATRCSPWVSPATYTPQSWVHYQRP